MAQEAKAEDKVVPTYGGGKCNYPCAVLLWSSLSSNAHQTSAQKNVNDKLIAMKVRFEQLDGAQPELKEKRNELFNISNVRGKYPQIFITDDKGKATTYVGMDDIFQV